MEVWKRSGVIEVYVRTSLKVTALGGSNRSGTGAATNVMGLYLNRRQGYLKVSSKHEKDGY